MPVEYGFIDLQNILGQRVADNESVVWDAVRETVEEYNRIVEETMSALVERTTVHQERYMLPGVATLEPLDENGNPLPRRVSGYYTTAYPIQRGGYAWGGNREVRALITVDEVQRQISTARQADLDWLLRHMLAAVFDNVEWTYADEQHGDLTIKPLANGDDVIYTRRGIVEPAKDNHYLAQAAAIDDANNPFPTIYDELSEHPSNNVTTGNPIVTFIAKNLRTSVEGLAGFEEPEKDYIIPGIMNDRADASIRSELRFGDRVLGVVDDQIIVQWDVLPSNYMMSIATGAGPFVKMREQPAAELQGLFPEFNDVDGNRHENRLIRIAGFGVANRVAACVTYIGGAAYVVPSAYDAPLAK